MHVAGSASRHEASWSIPQDFHRIPQPEFRSASCVEAYVLKGPFRPEGRPAIVVETETVLWLGEVGHAVAAVLIFA